jgi:hypothetical protein
MPLSTFRVWLVVGLGLVGSDLPAFLPDGSFGRCSPTPFGSTGAFFKAANP